MDFAFNTAPMPPRSSGLLWVERVEAAAKLHLACLSSHIFGIWTHFHKKGTRPCYKDTSRCEGGHEPESLRWKGYVHAYDVQQKRQVFLQLTVRAARMWLDEFGGSALLRGHSIYVSRTAAANGRVSLRVAEHESFDEDRLAPERTDFMPSLFKLWKMQPVQLAADTRRILTVEDLPPDEDLGQVG